MANYELLDQIGSGGMAVIHRARQRLAGFDRIVAIKQMQPQLAERIEYRERFTREARIVGALAHANIVQVYDATDRFIAMEYLEGWSLLRIVATAISAGIEIPIGVVLSILHELCDALDHVHTRCGRDGAPLGIVHRDLSLGNLFVTRSGHLKLIDFGIATAPGIMADDGRICGKPSYMAPEVIRGRDSDARADVFAIGVIAWELLAAKRLFTANDDEATMREVLFAGPVPPSKHRKDSPPMLDSLVLEALAKTPEKRTASAAIMRQQLEIVMRACQVEVRSSMVARWLAETGLDAMAVSEPTRIETPAEIATELASVLEPCEEEHDELATVPRKDKTPVAQAWPAQAQRTPTPFAWQATVAPARATKPPFVWNVPSLRSAPVSWSRAAVLAAAIAVGPIALAARGGTKEPVHAPVAMTVTQIEPETPVPAPAPAVAVRAAATPAPRANITPVAARVRRAQRSVPAEDVEKPIEKPIEMPIDKPIEAALHVAPAITVAPAMTIAPPIEATPPVARARGPIMIRPDEVHRTSGEIERIDGRRVERDGGPKKLSAVLCIDERGSVSSVRLLAKTPAWLGEILIRDLRAFRFTRYPGGAACFVRQLEID